MISHKLKRLVLDCQNYEDNPKDFHPEPNVMSHLYQTWLLAALRRTNDWGFQMAALLHDVGKNTTDGQKWREHAYRGAKMICSDVTCKVHWLVANHMRYFFYENSQMKKQKRKELEEHPWFKDLQDLNKCDRGGRAEMEVSEDMIHKAFSLMSSCDPRPGRICMTLGPPGVGKTTWAKEIAESNDNGDSHVYTRICRDEVRWQLGSYLEHQEEVVTQIVRKLALATIGRGDIPILDQTNCVAHHRKSTMDWYNSQIEGLKFTAVVFAHPVEVALDQNELRERKVPERVIKQMHGNLCTSLGGQMARITDEQIREKLVKEGFDTVEVRR